MSRPGIKLSRRQLLGGAASAAAVAATQGLGGLAQAAARPVRIGFSMAKTGYLGMASPVALQAYELWKAQVNEAGGLEIAGEGRRPVEFVIYDDQSEPVKAAEAYEKLISRDKVDLLLAPYGTPFHIAIGPVVERHRVPLIGNTATTTLLRDLKARYMWFTQSMPDAYARMLAGFLAAQGVKSASLLTLQLPASLETKKFVMPLLKEAGIAVPVNSEYAVSVSDMTGMLGSVKNAKPQAVVALSYPGDSVLYVNAARESGIDVPIQFLFIGPCTPFFFQKFSRPVIEGIVTLGEWAPSQARWPGAKAFFDAYSAKWGEPPDYLDSTICYASCQILQQAVATAGLDREKLRQTISSDTFQTIKGPIRYANAENVSTVPGLLQIQNGGMEIVWPKEIATAEFKPKKGWA
ncbi:amino acid ABC transporter substrate-binding protein [Pigmentiphaga soli]